MSTGDMLNASLMLSNPCALASSGSRFFSSTSRLNRSRKVFWYSSRLSRRNTTRPSAARRCSSDASNVRFNDPEKAARSAGAGWLLRLAGGISPAATRS